MIKEIVYDIQSDFSNIPDTLTDYKKFGVMMGVMALLISSLGFRNDTPWFPYGALIGTTILFFGLVAPKLLQPVYRIWMKFSVVLGFFMTRVILSGVFFLLLTPLAIIARLSGKQFLEFSFKQESYWRTRKTQFRKERYDKQY